MGLGLKTTWRARQDYVPPPVDQAEVGGHVVSGSLWSGIGVGVTTLIQFVRSMVFARLLMPADFGVISLAMVFTNFILLFANFGFNSSVIYQREVTRLDLSTCWWGNLAVDSAAVLACLAFAFGGGHRFFDDAQLPWVIALLSAQFLIVSVASINSALMRRRFMFKETALVSIISAVAGFAAAWIAVAIFKWGVFGLIAGMVFGTFLNSVMYFGYLPWLPSLRFSWANLRKHTNYGRWFVGVNVVTYGNQNIDRVLIGTGLDHTQLGYYDYASNLPMQITIHLSTVLNSVLFPAFASLQDNLQELRRVLLRVMRYNVLILYPMLVGLLLVAPEFVAVAYGPKWAPIVVPSQIFCVFGMIRALTNPYYALCNGVGKPALPFKWSLIALPFNAALLWLGVKSGLIGVTLAKLFLPLFILLTLGLEIMRTIGMPVRQIGRAIWPALVCCVALAAAVLGVRVALRAAGVPVLPSLLAMTAAGGAAYALALRAFYPDDFAGVVGFAKRLKGGGTA